MAAEFETVDEYIATFPGEVQEILQRVRRTIHDALPGLGERISYDIPTMTRDGKNLVHFAGWKKHISVYPLPHGDPAFQLDLEPYVAGKGTAKFPLSAPIPYALIGRLATFLAEER